MSRFDANRFASIEQSWETPRELFNQLNGIFRFRRDVCASPTNGKCDKFWSQDDDCLSRGWSGVNWMNPPFAMVKGFVKKAFAERHRAVTVCLVPARTNTDWWFDCCRHGAIFLIHGRIRFEGCEGGLPQPLALVVFGLGLGPTLNITVKDNLIAPADLDYLRSLLPAADTRTSGVRRAGRKSGNTEMVVGARARREASRVYSRYGITLLLADCERVLPHLERSSAHLLLLDPNYGRDRRSTRRKGLTPRVVGDDKPFDVTGVISLGLPSLIRKRHVYCFAPNDKLWDLSPLPITGHVNMVWDKCRSGIGSPYRLYSPSFEFIQFGVYMPSIAERERGDGTLAARLRGNDAILRVSPVSGKLDPHPYEKPVLLYRNFIESSTRPGEIVLDPCMGSGASMEAALLSGRFGVGVETDVRWFDRACARIDRLGADLAKHGALPQPVAKSILDEMSRVRLAGATREIAAESWRDEALLVLGLSADASVADIRRAFFDRAWNSHPDRGGNVAAFASVGWAYRVLSGNSNIDLETTIALPIVDASGCVVLPRFDK